MKSSRTKAAHEARKRSGATSVAAPQANVETKNSSTPTGAPSSSAKTPSFAPSTELRAGKAVENKTADAPARGEWLPPKVGRPTKQTPELIERVCRYVRAGSFIESSALACGITRQTLYLWMRTGNAARDDELAYAQRGMEVEFTPQEQRCVYFLDAMEEALGQAETDWLCRIVEAGGEDWRALSWRAQRRTRLPHGYRACGEWDQGTTESTLAGVQERQAARDAWTKKMKPWAAAAAAAAELNVESAVAEGYGETSHPTSNAESAVAKGDGETSHRIAEGSEGIAEARKSGNAEESEDAEMERLPNADCQVPNGQTSGDQNVEYPTSNAEHRSSDGRPVDAGCALAQGSFAKPQEAGLAGKMVKKSGGFVASVVMLLGLWLMGPARGWAHSTDSTSSPQAGSGQAADESGVVMGEAGDSGTKNLGARNETLTRSATDTAECEQGAGGAKASRLPLPHGLIAGGEVERPRPTLKQGKL